MRDRQQVPGGIDQQEVLGNTCPNTATQAPVQPQFNNNNNINNNNQAWQNQWTSTNKPPSPYNGLNKASWNNNNNLVNSSKNSSKLIEPKPDN